MSGEGSDTTHFDVVDAEGNAVAVTFTLNSQFGSGVTVPRLGFILNNNMDNFAADPGKPNQYGLIQGEANAIQPGKRPVASMTPTILLRDGNLYMIVGTPGIGTPDGTTILSSVLQGLVNVLDFPHECAGCGERGALPSPMVSGQDLHGAGIEFRASNNDVMMILAHPDGWQAGVDPRHEAKAAGY